MITSETIDDAESKGRLTTSTLDLADLFFANNTMKHIGGTFVERLATGDKVTIMQGEKTSFVYSGDGGGPLTFRGELIAASNFGG